jgi:hypothetical protein
MDRSETIEDLYRHGHCYPMASALHDRLGWPIQVLIVNVPGGLHPVHAWVADPDGGLIDAGGRFAIGDVYAEYLNDSRRKWSNDRIETFSDNQEFLLRLRQCFGNDEQWPWYQQLHKTMTATATEVVEDYVLPRYLPETVLAPAPCL